MRSVARADDDCFDSRLDSREETALAGDLELEPIAAEVEDSRSVPLDYLVGTYPADITLEELHRQWKDGELLIPRFRPQFDWRPVQASRLIESFLLRLPVPPIYLYSEQNSRRQVVMDGGQRLASVFHYFDGCFPAPGSPENDAGHEFGESAPAGPVFRLRGLPPGSYFHRRAFEELGGHDRCRLQNAVLRAYFVQPLDPEEDRGVYDIFQRLHTNGAPLANQEIRNCIHHGDFVELLDELNEFPPWRAILGAEAPDSRSRDMELLVRFFATRNLDEYRTPMKAFLSRYMRKNRRATRKLLAADRRLFERTCEATVGALGARPFHLRRGLNVAVLDAVMVAFSRNRDGIPGDIRARYRDLVGDRVFLRNTTERTTDADRVRVRFRQAAETLFRA